MQADKFSKERRDLNERVEQLTADVSRRERSVLQLENQKESLKEQLLHEKKQLEETRADADKLMGNHNEKHDDIKKKLDTALDDLTQSRITYEREKALKE